jgi:hypothetical protein
MRRTIWKTLAAGGLAAAALVLAAAPFASAHQDVTLRGYDGAPIDPATSTAPYSPRQTCGGCHDYERITQGYHFQQGFDVISDRYSEAEPWIKSPGMVGKW